MQADVTCRAVHAAGTCINSHGVRVGWSGSIFCCQGCSSGTKALRGCACCRWCWQRGLLSPSNRLHVLCCLSCHGQQLIVSNSSVCVCVSSNRQPVQQGIILRHRICTQFIVLFFFVSKSIPLLLVLYFFFQGTSGTSSITYYLFV